MKRLFMGIILLFLVACDPAVYYEKIIQNDSSYDIWLTKSDNAAVTELLQDSVLLLSKQQLVLTLDSDIGGSLDQYESCPLYPFPSDTLFTRIEGNSDLTLNFVIDENADWNYTVIEPGKNGEAECRLVITDEDVQ